MAFGGAIPGVSADGATGAGTTSVLAVGDGLDGVGLGVDCASPPLMVTLRAVLPSSCCPRYAWKITSPLPLGALEEVVAEFRAAVVGDQDRNGSVYGEVAKTASTPSEAL